MRAGAPVADRFLRHDDPEIVRKGIDDRRANAAACRDTDHDQRIDAVVAQPGFKRCFEKTGRFVLKDDDVLSFTRRVGFRPLVRARVLAIDRVVGDAEFEIPDTALDRKPSVIATAVIYRQIEGAERLGNFSQRRDQRGVFRPALRKSGVDEHQGGIDVQQGRPGAISDLPAESALAIGFDLVVRDKALPFIEFVQFSLPCRGAIDETCPIAGAALD